MSRERILFGGGGGGDGTIRKAKNSYAVFSIMNIIEMLNIYCTCTDMF
jgi:hypothetical protein